MLTQEKKNVKDHDVIAASSRGQSSSIGDESRYLTDANGDTFPWEDFDDHESDEAGGCPPQKKRKLIVAPDVDLSIASGGSVAKGIVAKRGLVKVKSFDALMVEIVEDEKKQNASANLDRQKTYEIQLKQTQNDEQKQKNDARKLDIKAAKLDLEREKMIIDRKKLELDERKAAQWEARYEDQAMSHFRDNDQRR
jgi:hypothetical protein